MPTITITQYSNLLKKKIKNNSLINKMKNKLLNNKNKENQD